MSEALVRTSRRGSARLAAVLLAAALTLTSAVFVSASPAGAQPATNCAAAMTRYTTATDSYVAAAKNRLAAQLRRNRALRPTNPDHQAALRSLRAAEVNVAKASRMRYAARHQVCPVDARAVQLVDLKASRTVKSYENLLARYS